MEDQGQVREWNQINRGVKRSGQPRPGRNVKSLSKGQPGKSYVNMRKKNADEDK